jgi:hypothetical protein
MSENSALWDILGRTDPKHTQQFKRGGGFKGTAIKPIWSYRRMTEEFGPCGLGWGVGEPTFQVVQGVNNELLVYCTASVWYTTGGDTSQTVYGVGGDKIVTHIRANEQYNRPERWENDDEAFKKAFTDAVTNALKLIGVGADVHMGLFDDNKYVNTMREEFAETPAEKPVSSASLKKPDENGKTAWNRLEDDLDSDMADCHTLVALNAIKDVYRARARKENWPNAWMAALKDRFEAEENRIKAAMEPDTFPGDIRTNQYAQNVSAG